MADEPCRQPLCVLLVIEVADLELGAGRGELCGHGAQGGAVGTLGVALLGAGERGEVGGRRGGRSGDPPRSVSWLMSRTRWIWATSRQVSRKLPLVMRVIAATASLAAKSVEPACRRVGAFGRGSVMGAYLDRLNVEAAQRDKVLIRRSSDSSRVAMVRHG